MYYSVSGCEVVGAHLFHCAAAMLRSEPSRLADSGTHEGYTGPQTNISESLSQKKDYFGVRVRVRLTCRFAQFDIELFKTIEDNIWTVACCHLD